MSFALGMAVASLGAAAEPTPWGAVQPQATLPAGAMQAAERMAAQGAGGFSVGTGVGGELLALAHFGGMAPDAQYPIASASKWLAAATAMALVDAGMLSIDQPVSTWLPALPAAAGELTLRQLLSQTSGLAGARGELYELAQDHRITLAMSALEVAQRPLVSSPGAVFAYGGPGFQLVGAAVEAATGQRWAQVFEERIAQPLRMDRTYWTHLRLDRDDALPMAERLFTPLRVGAIEVPNRIFMAPMTRLRAQMPGDLPTALTAHYYAQRATAGLVIAEATDISPQARGYAGSPGIHTPAQITAWRAVTDAIHREGGHCSVQLWHTGRNSHTSLQPGHAAPVAPSAIHSHSRTSLRDASGQVVRVETSQPRALERHEIPRIVGDFRTAVVHARAAGFDLVELHAAHGYLLHQFLSPASNQRTDDYGGSLQNRVRFVLEVVDAAIDAWAADRIGIRLFPSGPFKGILSTMGPQADEGDTQQDALYLIAELAKRKLAYLHLSEPDWTGGVPLEPAFRRQIRAAYPGVVIGSGGYTYAKAEQMLAAGHVDAVAFGRAFIANPDLVARLRQQAPLNTADSATFYGGSEGGYTDYPRLGAIGA